MVKLARTFSRFHSFTALVIGDFMLDTYTTGAVKRISPEAPVPVMQVEKIESRPGGAGNVVLNLRAVGGIVHALGRVGDDPAGKELKAFLNAPDLLVEKGYITPVKNRLIAGSQQLLRIDQEKIESISSLLQSHLLERFCELAPHVQIIAISDYGKGGVTPSLLEKVIAKARELKIPVIVDPKGVDFARYKGATLLKPNLSEAYAAAKVPSQAPLEAVARAIFETAEVEKLLITRSENGMSLFEKTGERVDFPVRSREVKDVTGAGDTVLAFLSLALASDLDIETAVQLSNTAASLSIERLGCVQITLADLARRVLEFDSESKIFDDSQSFALHQILKGKKYTLLVLYQGQTMTTTLFQILKTLSDREVVIYVKGCPREDEFIHLLSSLQEVQTIILQQESLKDLCEKILPYEVYTLEEEGIQVGKELLTSLLDLDLESAKQLQG